MGNHNTLGKVRRYEATPPQPIPGKESDLSQFPLRLVKLDFSADPKATGWDKYRISIPPTIRGRYLDDAIYSAEWKSLMNDFDAKLLLNVLMAIFYLFQNLVLNLIGFIWLPCFLPTCIPS